MPLKMHERFERFKVRVSELSFGGKGAVMQDAAIVLLAVFTSIATVDGFYFHIYKYRLYARPECAREHELHTLNAVLFPFTLAPLFLATTTGAWLWLTALVIAGTLAIESLDVLSEGDSRAKLGGLTPVEYLMHFLMSGLRWASLALAFAAVPAASWTAGASWEWHAPLASPLVFLAWCIGLVAVPVALVHVFLAVRGPLRTLAEGTLRLHPMAHT
jgi:hypothetical protein